MSSLIEMIVPHSDLVQKIQWLKFVPCYLISWKSFSLHFLALRCIGMETDINLEELVSFKHEWFNHYRVSMTFWVPCLVPFPSKVANVL